MCFAVGLDLSLSCTGVAVIDDEGILVTTAAIKTKACNGVRGRVGRYDQLSKQIVSIINSYSPCDVLIEGYSFGSKGRGQIDRAESGGVIRHQIITQCPGVRMIDEIAPLSLQKEVTGYGGGKGKEKKKAMKDAVEEVYGELGYKTSDQYDAVGLALVLWWRENSE
ncbi:RuvC Holliday junction resolvasome, endonuclease subunit [uncultured Caudovirales phage]|uniref:RuvC Holliday junction resolvasome, endonuclease subunit n=1 Tax=uncultured Caudovirales phage TaxID=2100421 RepID=A0A6J5NSH9_9CAUD|nr:RuvC Holliday junction resolvasome, endonuclease subunit [uncultured Caudovirales phage]